MADENGVSEKKCCSNKHVNANGSSSAVYGMAFIGAAVYFIQHSATFWMGVLGILKALVWPAILVYKLLEYLKM
ncbi:MAG: hypothetical protein P4L45_14165 [Ignavibacteriaceae bacterium]|nr:hypothetical protein [Ignavibacteriaceae bacterium]